MKKFIYLLLILLIISCSTNQKQQTKPNPPAKITKTTEITISFAGDCTFGDYVDAEGTTFNWQFENVDQDYSFFFKNVAHIFKQDDLTLVNLETTLTNATEDRKDRKFRFKGNPSYVNILTSSGIEAVNISNNHIHDYGKKGFNETIQTLTQAGIYFSGEDYSSIYETKGKKIGMLGYRGWTHYIKPSIKQDIAKLKAQNTDLIIVSFHWGTEKENYPNDLQKDLAKFSIDNGADIIIGHHPHTLQGIEIYKQKPIVYSLGNFSFGGHKNPSDRDTMIYQAIVQFQKDENGNTTKKIKNNIIPALISSEKERNNYQPTIANAKDKKRILKRLQEYSEALVENKPIQIEN